LVAPVHGESAVVNLILLGDSTLDNGAYVPRGQDVEHQLGSRLLPGWSATLRAQDGAVLADVDGQLARIPPEATHILISAGGNDALHAAGILQQPVSSVTEALSRLAAVGAQFGEAYNHMLVGAMATGLPLAISTIYDAQLPDPVVRRSAATALTVLNDVILRQAAIRRLPVLDLRTLFDEPTDFANAIEPSAEGGAKIAQGIVDLVSHHDYAGPAALYGGRSG
jgi:lysophospholipase L1-like esterase